MRAGVFILEVNPTSPAAGHLRPGDVLLALGDTRVANDGTVAFRNGEAINIAYHLSQMQVRLSASAVRV